ncbi:HEAT repeat domain-containing protein [Nitrospira sp. NS4]|uniref:HEAT repeat domain-containing protein n=1 Tax=Nitrospira sp. NS4 TaxID=3414498 RepID=UPI003C2DD4E2
MDIVTWLWNALKTLESVQIYVLLVSVALLVTGILGGAPLRLKEFYVGPLSIWDRWLCGFTAAIVFTLWFLIPRSVESNKVMSVQGLVMMGAWSDVQPLSLQVNLEPASSLKTAITEADGVFEFPATAGLTEGTYNISISRDGHEVVNEHQVSLTQGDSVVVMTKDGKPPTVQVGDITNILINRYKSSPEWIDRVQVIERITAMNVHSVNLREKMTKLLSSQEPIEQELGAFTLGRLCEQATRNQLEQIKTKHPDWFLRIRASWNLSCDSSRRAQEHLYLLGILTKSDPTLTKGHRWAAAFFLARNLVKNTCVVSVLEGGLEAEKEAIREISLIMLNRLTEKQFSDKTAWKSWWATADHSSYDSCPPVG